MKPRIALDEQQPAERDAGEAPPVAEAAEAAQPEAEQEPGPTAGASPKPNQHSLVDYADEDEEGADEEEAQPRNLEDELECFLSELEGTGLLEGQPGSASAGRVPSQPGGEAPQAAAATEAPAAQRDLGPAPGAPGWRRLLDGGSCRAYCWHPGSGQVRWDGPPGAAPGWEVDAEAAQQPGRGSAAASELAGRVERAAGSGAASADAAAEGPAAQEADEEVAWEEEEEEEESDVPLLRLLAPPSAAALREAEAAAAACADAAGPLLRSLPRLARLGAEAQALLTVLAVLSEQQAAAVAQARPGGAVAWRDVERLLLRALCALRGQVPAAEPAAVEDGGAAAAAEGGGSVEEEAEAKGPPASGGPEAGPEGAAEEEAGAAAVPSESPAAAAEARAGDEEEGGAVAERAPGEAPEPMEAGCAGKRGQGQPAAEAPQQEGQLPPPPPLPPPLPAEPPPAGAPPASASTAAEAARAAAGLRQGHAAAPEAAPPAPGLESYDAGAAAAWYAHYGYDYYATHHPGVFPQAYAPAGYAGYAPCSEAAGTAAPPPAEAEAAPPLPREPPPEKKRRRAAAGATAGEEGRPGKPPKLAKGAASLISKWQAVRKEVVEAEAAEEAAAEAAADPAAVEARRLAEAEAWRTAAAQGGSAGDNPNLMPLAGDWRERMKKAAEKKDRKEMRRARRAEGAAAAAGAAAPLGAATGPASAAAGSASAPPDLQALSRGLPTGWVAAYDSSHQAVYYANAASGASSWRRPE